jgi:mannosyltransferase
MNKISNSHNISSINTVFNKHKMTTVLLGLIILLTATLRFYNIGAKSYWVDEMFSVVESQQPIQQILTSGRFDQPPAYYLSLHAWIKAFGDNEVSTRSFSALAGIGSVILIFFIGQKLFNEEVGLLGAFLMSIALFQIEYSQEARFYSFFQFATLLSFLSLIIAIKTRKSIHFFIYIVASIFMLFSHTYGVFIMLGQNFFIIFQWKKNKSILIPWFISQGLIFIIYLPYFLLILFSDSNVGSSIVNQIAVGDFDVTLFDPVRAIYRFILPARLNKSWGEVFSFYAIAAVFFLACTGIYVFRAGRHLWINEARNSISNFMKSPNIKSNLLLLGSWLLFPIFLPFLFSIVFTPIHRERYAICAAPAIYLLLALGIFNFRKVVPWGISLVAFVIMIVPGTRDYYVEILNEQWREAAAYIEENVSGDEIFVYAPSTIFEIEQKTFNWYYKSTVPECYLTNELISDSERWEALSQCASEYKRFWVIIRQPSENENPSLTYETFFLNETQEKLHMLDSRLFYKVSVYLFEFVE